MKNQIGINVWRQIQGVLKDNWDIVARDLPHNQVLRLIATDPDLDFFFEFGPMSKEGYYEVKYKPSDLDTVRISHSNADHTKLISSLEAWVGIIRQWAIYPTPYDDNIENFYQKEYFDEYKIVDPLANVEPFSAPQMALLDAYIGHVKEVVAEKKKDATEKEVAELESVEAQCEILQKNLPRWTKNQVVASLSKMWARLKKFGIKFGNDIVLEGSKVLVKGIIDISSDTAKGYFDITP